MTKAGSRPPCRPRVTMSDIYGPGVVNNPRPSFRPFSWMPDDEAFWASRSGLTVTVLGAMPTLAAEGLRGGAALRLMELAGIEGDPTLLVYRDRAEYEAQITAIRRRGLKLVFQHAHPPHERPSDDYWIPPEVLHFLNDKASLGALVPEEHLPKRRLIPVAEVEQAVIRGRRWPVVLKGTGPASSGGGTAVVIVAHAAELSAAIARLARSESIVVEEFIDIRSNTCLGYAATPTGNLYLGAADQLTDGQGRFCGNWLGGQVEPPAAAVAVGHEILRRARARGFRGLCGFDIVVDSEGRVVVLDLNFRNNFSSPALIWLPTLRERIGPEICCHNVRDEIPLKSKHWWRVAAEFVSAGRLFPISVYDPAASVSGSYPAALHGIWIGTTRREAQLARRSFLDRLGIAGGGRLARAA